MASFEIIVNQSPYYTIDVSFADQKFRQNAVFQENGEWLSTAMQAYADNYELNWVEAETVRLTSLEESENRVDDN